MSNFFSVKWAVVRYYDGQLSGVIKATEVEDDCSGETLQEAVLEEGDKCMAKWSDGKMYEAKVIVIAGKYHTIQFPFLSVLQVDK